MSLLFCSYVLFAPGEPVASYFAHRQPVALIPYIPRTLACCKASQSRLPSDATHAAFEPFLWCHPRKQNGHTRHLVATKVGAVVFATSGRNDARCGWGMEPNTHGCRTFQSPPTRPARVTCGRLVVPRTQSDGWVVQAARARSVPTLTAAARPTELACAACTAWGAAAAGDARASEPARWDGPSLPCRCCPLHPAPCQKTHRYH